MIGKVVASIYVAFSTECTVEIKQTLLHHCEHIAASCVTSDREKKAAGNITVRSESVFCFVFCFIPFDPDPLGADTCEQYRIHLYDPCSQCIHLTLAVQLIIS
jgi:hypothetical protein